jgi:hypothetical protein
MVDDERTDEEAERGIRIFVGGGVVDLFIVVGLEDGENVGVTTLSIIAFSLKGQTPII